jgi:hypothetical protein
MSRKSSIKRFLDVMDRFAESRVATTPLILMAGLGASGVTVGAATPLRAGFAVTATVAALALHKRKDTLQKRKEAEQAPGAPERKSGISR